MNRSQFADVVIYGAPYVFITSLFFVTLEGMDWTYYFLAHLFSLVALGLFYSFTKELVSTGWKIFLAVVLGVALATLGFFVFLGDIDAIRKVFSEKPPWTLFTALAAAPSALLTWYWRTTKRDKEIKQKDRDLDHKEIELKAKEEEAINIQFVEGVRLIASDRERERLAGIYDLDRIARESSRSLAKGGKTELQERVLDIICLCLRNRADEITRSNQKGNLNTDLDVVIAFQAVANRSYLPNYQSDLRGANLIPVGVNIRSPISLVYGTHKKPPSSPKRRQPREGCFGRARLV